MRGGSLAADHSVVVWVEIGMMGRSPGVGMEAPTEALCGPGCRAGEGQGGVSKNTYLNGQDAAVEGRGLWGNLW